MLYSRGSNVKPLIEKDIELKSEAVRGLRKFLADSNSYGKIERMRSDGGGEFISKEFEQVCIDNKIKIA